MRAFRSGLSFRPSLCFLLLIVLLATLWIAGGASRADASGQIVVRAVCWTMLTVAALFAPRPNLTEAKPVVLLLAAAVGLVALQLIPLPPALWQALPGRTILVEAAAASNQPQPWRPWSIVPGATINALGSLVVPLTALILMLGLHDAERAWLPGLVLSIVVAATLAGLLQVSGAGFNNPLINDTPGEVSGSFANRNHLALLLAMGCLLAPVWAFLGGRRAQWRGAIALGLVLLFALTILATGSRAGLALGVIGLVLGLAMVRDGIRRTLNRYPRWVFPAMVAGLIGLIAVFVVISIAADRAASVDRAFTIDSGQDMRRRGFPIVLAMIGTYFPVGSGLGGFDPVFRMHEPFELLKPTYFNHAHNDWLEVVLDAGLPGLLLLVAGLVWWGWASLHAWKSGGSLRHALPKLGSAMLLLVMGASIFDYPARTPMVMTLMVIAGLWLNGSPADASRASALPAKGEHL